MNNHELDPRLEKMLNSLQETPERGLQDSHAGRENYIAQVKSLKPGRAASRRTSRQRRPAGRQAWLTRFAAVAAVILVALTSLGGTVYAAQAALPDDLLYPVKTFTEEIQVRLEGDPEDKLDLYVSFANRRLQEIQIQLAAGDQVSEKALELLEQHTRNMLEQAAKLEEGAMQRALHQIENNLQLQHQMMSALGKDDAQGNSEEMEQAQERIRERLEMVKDGIKEPKSFRERMQNQAPGAGQGPGNPDTNQGDSEGPGSGQGTPSGNGSGGK